MMEIIQVKDKSFSLYIPEEKIKERVKLLGKQLSADLCEKHPLFLVILNGSFIFAADLLRELDFPCEITFIRVASYDGISTTGEVKQVLGLKESIEGRTVVIVEDIIDTGYTMKELLQILNDKHPKDIHIASLFVKPNNLKVELNIDYRCFNIENDFIVGYGLDYDQEGRNLSSIYKVID